MFGFFKNILRKSGATSDENNEPVAAESAPAPAAPPLRANGPAPARAPYGNGNGNATGIATAPAHGNGIAQAAPASGKGVEIPLKAVLDGLPLELQPRIRQLDVGDATILIPLEKILSQLSRGTVKISFGELRAAAAGVFSSEIDKDRALVPMPLGEILARINPTLITRRRVQKQIEVPAEISSPFDPAAAGMNFSIATPKAETAPRRAPTPPPAAPLAPRVVSSPGMTPMPARGAITSSPTPPPPTAQPPLAPAMIPASRAVRELTSNPPQAPAPKPPIAPVTQAPIRMPEKPVAPPQPAFVPQPRPALPPKPAPQPISMPQPADLPSTFSRQPQPVAQSVPKPQPPAAPQPIATPQPIKMVQPIQMAQPAPLVQEQIATLPEEPIFFQSPAAAEAEAQALPEEIPAVQPVVQPVAPVPVGPPLIANLIALAETWPENVRKELVQCNLMDAKVALPVAEIGEGMRQGRIAFTWKRVRSWVKAPALPPTSPEDNTIVELPLKIVAPLYLDRQREGAKAQEKTKIDEEIPNLFFGFPQPDPAADADATVPAVPAVPALPESDHAVARPVDTNYYIWDDTSDSVKVDAAEVAHASPGTKFVARYATPNEVVSRATALAGVAGALIALPDGLMVASQLSSDLNGDTLAAFLPQIFAKVTQCTKELRMGELNNLNFTVGNVPWKIFRVNAIFFAAFGRSGEALPTGQLAALAAELDHKPK